jgi:hypothetical protein
MVIPRTSSSSSSSSSDTHPNYRVHASRSMPSLPDQQRANEMLCQLIRVTQPLLIRRQLRVMNLIEFYPKNGSLLGLNVNRGVKIMVRLRAHDQPQQFLDMESVLGTFVHELVHNLVSEHSFEFYSLLDTLEGEVQRDMVARGCHNVNQIPTHKVFQWEDSTGHKLGGSHKSQTTNWSPTVHGKGQRLGGKIVTAEVPGNRTVRLSGESRDLLLRAAEKRQSKPTPVVPTTSRLPSSSSSTSCSFPSSSNSIISKGPTSTTLKSAPIQNQGCGFQAEFLPEDLDPTFALTQEIDLTDAWELPISLCSPCQPLRNNHRPSLLSDVDIEIDLTLDDFAAIPPKRPRLQHVIRHQVISLIEDGDEPVPRRSKLESSEKCPMIMDLT